MFGRWTNPSLRAREVQLAQCGKECFLVPDEKKFPVCAPSSCTFSCAGLHAAYVRAREWKYEEVAAKAARMMEQRCGWHPKLLGGSVEQAQRALRWGNRSVHKC